MFNKKTDGTFTNIFFKNYRNAIFTLMENFHVNYIYIINFKKHLQNPLICRVSQKPDTTFKNHVYITQKLNLHSTL